MVVDATETASTKGSAPVEPDAGRAAWFLYLIECRDGSLYTGIAIDVAVRYAAHLAGKGARYTRAHPPTRLIGWIGFPDRSSASRAEYRVKQLKPAEKRRYFADARAEAPRQGPSGPGTPDDVSRTTPAATAPDSCA